jgi:pimeloyl-ACP methyl ester carboxylesterase
MGSSYGAYTALILTVRHPELVRSLTLGEPPILPWLEGKKECTQTLTAFATNAWEPSKRAFQRGDMEEGVRSFINGVLGEGAFDKLPREVRAVMIDNAPEMKAETSSPVYFSEFTCDDARKIKAPTLLLTGELSPPMFRQIIKELKRCMHEADCSEIPRSSHMMQAGNPEAFNAKVMGFISRRKD